MGKNAQKPDTPNFAGVAQQQAGMQQESYNKALQANRPNQVGPTGSLNWSQDPSGNWTQTTTMNPQEKAIMEAGQGNQLALGGKIGEQLGGFDTGQVNFSGAPTMPEVGGYDQRSIDTIRALQAPQLERQRAAKEAQMAAMGLGTGSGNAWNTEQQNIGDTENRADMNAILSGIQQGNTMFGQGMQARQQGVGETLQQNQANLGKLSGLMGLARGPQMPQFQNVNQVGMAPTADLMGAAKQQYGADVGRYNIDRAEDMAPWQMAAQLGGAALGGPMGGQAASGLMNYFNKPKGVSNAWYNDSV
jgi:hypothetical protein